MVCNGYPQTCVKSVSGSISEGTGRRSKSSLSGSSLTPNLSSSVCNAFQKAAFCDRISGRLYIGRLTLAQDMREPSSPTILSPKLLFVRSSQRSAWRAVAYPKHVEGVQTIVRESGTNRFDH